MRETTFTELRNHAKTFFDAVEEGETVRVYRNGRPVADIVPVKTAMPAWKKPPRTRLSLRSLSLSDEVLADRTRNDEGLIRHLRADQALRRGDGLGGGESSLRRGGCFGVSILVLPELISTLCRLVREGRLSSQDYQSLKSALQTDLSDADLCDFSQGSFDQTIRCLEKHPLRALDALHVGSALAYQPDLFVSADRRRAKAASREGLAVVDLSL